MQQHSDAHAMAQYKQQVGCGVHTRSMGMPSADGRPQAKKILKRLSSLASLPTEMSIESNEYVFQCVCLRALCCCAARDTYRSVAAT